MTNEISVVDLAKELRRLANCLVRELGKDPGVAPLSYIAAIKPLVNYISEEYSGGIALCLQQDNLRRKSSLAFAHRRNLP